MAATAMSFSAACAGTRVVGGAAATSSNRSRAMATGGRSLGNKVFAMKASSATGGAARAKESMVAADGVSGVARAKRAQRGKVIVEAVPDSFVPGQMPESGNEKNRGFWEVFFGHNPNKGKIRAPLQFRFFSLLPYLIPCMGAIAFTDQAFMVYPITFKIAVAISPLLQIFYSNSFIPFVTFFTLFLAVVRNVKLNHFLRYNTMQAILLDICVMLAGLIMQYLPMYVTTSFLGDFLELMTLVNALFAILYCMWNVIQGQYPEIPIITEAVYAQVVDQ